MITTVTTNKMETSTTSPLLELPLELLEDVASYLSAEDSGSLRLTCRALEQASFGQFSRQFFKTMRFLMPALSGPASMQTLIDISLHPALSLALRRVILLLGQDELHEAPGIEHLGKPKPTAYPLSILNLAPDGNFGNGSGATGRDRAMLAEVFSRLANLETIYLRFFSSEPTTRSSKFKKPVRFVHYREHYGDRHEFNDHVFAVTLAALADAGARPKNLVSGFARFYNRNMYDAALYIPAQLEPKVAAVLSSLTKLRIGLFWGEDTPRLDPPCWRKFLSLATNLIFLRIRFWYSDQDTLVLSWIGRQPAAQLPEYHSNTQYEPAPTWSPPLRRLSIHSARLGTPDTLRSIVTKFRLTLRTLKLHHVTLLDQDNNVDDRVNIWKALLKFIAKESDLTEWRFIGLNINFPGYRPYVAAVWPRRGPHYREYAGHDATAVLDAAAEALTVDWPGSRHSHDDESSGSDNGGGEDNSGQERGGLSEDEDSDPEGTAD